MIGDPAWADIKSILGQRRIMVEISQARRRVGDKSFNARAPEDAE